MTNTLSLAPSSIMPPFAHLIKKQISSIHKLITAVMLAFSVNVSFYLFDLMEWKNFMELSSTLDKVSFIGSFFFLSVIAKQILGFLLVFFPFIVYFFFSNIVFFFSSSFLTKFYRSCRVC